MRVVLDTNVVVSAHISSSSPLAAIRSAWEDKRFDILISTAILAEYERVFSYPHLVARHHLTNQEIASVINDLDELATMVDVTSQLDVVPADPTDNKFVECAVDGNAAYIVSGDQHLLKLGRYNGIQIVPPDLFLLLLEQ